MAEHDALIDELCARAAPVERVPPAWRRAALFVPLMLALGWGVAAILHRAVTGWAVPDGAMGIANAALSLLLGTAAFVRAFVISVPGRGRGVGWIAFAIAAWLALALGGIGEPAGLNEAYAEGRYCFLFLLAAGLPMVAVAIWALRRTFSLTPGPSLLTAGAGVAFLSFGLLAFCHPAATTLLDTLGHLAAALVLGALTLTLGYRAISA